MKRVPKFTGVYIYESEKGKDVTFYINYKDERGKQKFEKIGKKSEGYTATYAHNKRNERVQQVRHGETITKKKLSLNECFDEYYYPHVQKTVKNHKKEKDIYNKRIRNEIGDYDISKITPEIVQDFKIKLQTDGLSQGTIRNYLKLIRQIFNFTRSLELHNLKLPFKSGKYDNGVSIDAAKNDRERFLDELEIQQMLDYFCLEGSIVYELVLVAVYTGMRSGEIRELQWKSVDMTNKTITIVKSETKGKSSRSIPMHPKVYQLLSMKEQGKKDDYVWTYAEGKPLSRIPEIFTNYTSEMLNSNGNKENIVFHSLRHTFASHMAMRGTPIVVLQRLLGHASITQTQKYSHLIPDYSVKFIHELNY